MIDVFNPHILENELKFPLPDVFYPIISFTFPLKHRIDTST